jgi:hypothetical protein
LYTEMAAVNILRWYKLLYNLLFCCCCRCHRHHSSIHSDLHNHWIQKLCVDYMIYYIKLLKQETNNFSIYRRLTKVQALITEIPQGKIYYSYQETLQKIASDLFCEDNFLGHWS